jgi:hypothetical protein
MKVLLTADRPSESREVGEAQTITQVGIFSGIYMCKCIYVYRYKCVWMCPYRDIYICIYMWICIDTHICIDI